MLQKAVLGLALASEAAILLLDEPTANLDAESRLLLLQRLRELAPERTIVICSHRLDDLDEITDRAVVLEQGKVIHDGPIGGLRSGAEDGVPPVLRLVGGRGMS
jgi:ABC-type multidrug transport system ATPase subunit